MQLLNFYAKYYYNIFILLGLFMQILMQIIIMDSYTIFSEY